MSLHVPIPVIDSQRRGSEEIEVEHLGGRCYRVLCPPRFAHGLAVGDEIELDDRGPFGFRVLRHSGNLTVWFFAPAAGEEEHLAAAGRAQLPEVGGTLEGTPEMMMIVTVPLAAGWQRIEKALNAIAASLPGTNWYYANVYDPVDGCTPLRWWASRDQT